MAHFLSESQKIYFYCQILFWIEAQLNQLKQPVFIGLNAPQGAGKTTLTKWLVDQLYEKEIHAVSLSIDDFYLTREEQIKLAQENPDNPYLQQRGYPGTHDIELGVSTLQSLKTNRGEILIPRYSKSAHAGQGDRTPQEYWSVIDTENGPKVDVVLLEGWCLGFAPLGEAKALELEPALREVNERLKAYARWHEFLDAFIALWPTDKRFVIDWRIEAEQKMRMEGKDGMSDEDVRRYVEKFLPAYAVWGPVLRDNPLGFARFLAMEIGRHRLPV